MTIQRYEQFHGLQGCEKQAMKALQEMEVFNSLYGSLAAMLVFKIT